MPPLRTVKTYPSDTPVRDWLFFIAALMITLGIPVVVGCFIYVAGESAWSSMFIGASCGAMSMYGLVAIGGLCWWRNRRRLGKPLDPGERVEVISGTLTGQRGTVDMHGQGGPGTLYVSMDNSPDDELIVFEWKQLRRIEITPAAPPSPSSV